MDGFFTEQDENKPTQFKWYERREFDESIVISSRVRLARNLKNHPFPARLSDEDAAHVLSEIRSSILNDKSNIKNWFAYEEISHMEQSELLELLERHVISPEMAMKKGVRGFLLSHDESISVLLNEEDHARIQSIFAGDHIDAAYEMANKIDDLIEESVEYAFDSDFGYLTACPTNTGTGLRASYMLHIPALETTGNLAATVQAVGKFGIAVRGIHGEGSEPAGSIYQISNQTTLGKPEVEMISALKNVTAQITEQEKILSGKILKEFPAQTKDKVYRAHGILSQSRVLTTKEAMKLLSELRFGYVTGCLEMPKPKKSIYQMMMEIQRGSITKNAGRKLEDLERCILRANYVRSMFQ